MTCLPQLEATLQRYLISESYSYFFLQNLTQEIQSKIPTMPLIECIQDWNILYIKVHWATVYKCYVQDTSNKNKKTGGGDNVIQKIINSLKNKDRLHQYMQLVRKNVVLVGWVATGKTYTSKLISKNTFFKHLDTWLIYRGIAYYIDLYIQQQWLTIQEDNSTQQKAQLYKIIGIICKTITNIQVDIQDGITINDLYIPIDILHAPENTKITPYYAQHPIIRKKVDNYTQQLLNTGGYVLTWHSLESIDTIATLPILLTINNTSAVERVQNDTKRQSRNLTFNKVQEIIESRNIRDGIPNLGRYMPKLFMSTSINTNDSNIDYKILRYLYRSIKFHSIKNKNFIHMPNTLWQANIFLEKIKTRSLEWISSHKSFIPSVINEFDLSIQTILHAGAYSTEEWENDTSDTLLKKILEEQILRLNSIYLKSNLPVSYLNNKEKSPFWEYPEIKRNWNEWIEKETWRKISFKRIDADIGRQYGQELHYLKSARIHDVFQDYWAFLENEVFPFAWVSYSSVDRKYKQELLYLNDVEPCNILELTRAWNSIWSPRNTMSALFQFAHNDLQTMWEIEKAKWNTHESLQGIISAINPNLWFNWKAFRAVNMKPIWLKPARLSYEIHNNTFIYRPRRDIDDVNLMHMSQIPLLPTIELAVLFDPKKQKKLHESQKIYKITNNSYLNLK